LALALERVVNDQRLGKVVMEMLLRIDAARNVKRRPDLAFVSAARWPFGKHVPKAEAWDMVPDLAVEVVSKSNGAAEIVEKVRDYFQTGTRLVWVIYPSVRLVYVYTSETTVRILAEPADLDGGEVIPGFRVAINRLFGDEPDVEPPDDVAINPRVDR
jgi:Uma2 family endonuclease